LRRKVAVKDRSKEKDRMIAESEAGGPKTAQGKEVVRWNATRHGISSSKPVVPGLEKKEDSESHCDGIMENFSPAGHLEVTLAERVALLSWRLHRVTRYETESIAISQEQVEEDIHRRAMFLRSFRENPYASTPKTYTSKPSTTGIHITHSNASPLSSLARP
jgi:hypothetical protein